MKHCSSDQFVQQEIDYTYINPCKAKWNLNALHEQYNHSFAKYYLTGIKDFYKVDDLSEINDKILMHIVNTIMIDATSGNGRDVAKK